MKIETTKHGFGLVVGAWLYLYLTLSLFFASWFLLPATHQADAAQYVYFVWVLVVGAAGLVGAYAIAEYRLATSGTAGRSHFGIVLGACFLVWIGLRLFYLQNREPGNPLERYEEFYTLPLLLALTGSLIGYWLSCRRRSAP